MCAPEVTILLVLPFRMLYLNRGSHSYNNSIQKGTYLSTELIG